MKSTGERRIAKLERQAGVRGSSAFVWDRGDGTYTDSEGNVYFERDLPHLVKKGGKVVIWDVPVPGHA